MKPDGLFGARACPSLYAADPLHLARAVKKIEAAGAESIHFDVMDGHFVPALGLNAALLDALGSVTSLAVDVHLMCVDPLRLLPDFLGKNVKRVIVHAEAIPGNTGVVLDAIHRAGKQAWIALSPATNLAAAQASEGRADGILLMSCEPGVRGASYQQNTPDRVLALVAGGHTVMVDGALTPGYAEHCAAAGASYLVQGRSFFKAPT